MQPRNSELEPFMGVTGTRLSFHQLAQMLGISECQVEEHLTHVVKTPGPISNTAIRVTRRASLPLPPLLGRDDIRIA